MMEQSSVRADFEKAKENLKSNWYAKNVTAVLGAVRDVALDLQQGGFDVSLEMRMTGTDTAPYAKGMLRIDGTALDVRIVNDPDGYTTIAVELGIEGRAIGAYAVSPDRPDSLASMKTGLRKVILNAHAMAESYSSFDVNGGKQLQKSQLKPRLST